MTWNYAYTPQIWPPVLMAVLMIALAVYSGRRRSVPGATALMIASLFAATWAAASFLESMAVDLPVKITWFKVQAALQAPIVTAITCFILEYAWPGRWLTRRNLALLIFPCVLAALLTLTNDLHHLAWSSFSLINGATEPQVGPGTWLLLAYAFGVLVLVDLLVFGWLFWRSPQHRWPVVLMLAGQIGGRLIFLLDRAHVVRASLPLDLIGMSLEFFIFAIVLFGFRLLDPMPLARRTVVQQLQAGMLVLDPQGRIVSLNPAAQVILGKSEKQAVHHSILELLPAWEGLIQAAGQGEISLGAGSDAREYQAEISPLKDWRGVEVGRLFLLHDVTDQKRAQAQILDQQRALAMLHERERLGRELHDSIGQVLGYVSLQAQAIRKRAQGGDLAAVEAQLTRLAEVAQAAHTDVRDSILSLRTAGTGQGWSFRSALEQYLKAYGDQYGIQTSLSLPDGFEEGWFEPEAEVQLLRVIQEALTNARKHGQARCVQVAFMVEGGLIHMTIRDDGVGFDRSQAAGEGHYGLQFMRERVDALGGQIEVISQPGLGTQIIVRVPFNLTQRR